PAVPDDHTRHGLLPATGSHGATDAPDAHTAIGELPAMSDRVRAEGIRIGHGGTMTGFPRSPLALSTGPRPTGVARVRKPSPSDSAPGQERAAHQARSS